ncbi:MAG: hypothetical protein OXG95_00310 [Chloroflexi bacterium]|nr:hypothetical protein [Chloroflexota bacterium]
MAEPRKPTRPIDERTTDHEVLEMIFGKRVAEELERMAGVLPAKPS